MRALQRIRMHRWQRKLKVIAMIAVIVILIIVVAQARPPNYNQGINQDGDVPVVAKMDQGVKRELDIRPIPDKPVVPAQNDMDIEIDKENGNFTLCSRNIRTRVEYKPFGFIIF